MPATPSLFASDTLKSPLHSQLLDVFSSLPAEDQLVLLEFTAAFGRMIELTHKFNKKWWRSLETGEPITRNVGELLMLTVSELSEAMEGHRKNLYDDKLPTRPMFEVELADAIIRISDYAGGLLTKEGLPYDVPGALLEKMLFNLIRKDHTHEHRMGEFGKKY